MTFSPPEAPRKRTSSFSCAVPPSPRPAKALRRTETLLSFADATPSSPLTTTLTKTPLKGTTPCAPAAVPYHRTLQYYKDQRLKRKALSRAGEPLAICTVPTTTPTATITAAPTAAIAPLKPTAPLRPRRPTQAPQVILPSVQCPITTLHTPRSSSPLAPTSAPRPPRPVFPRARAPPDLYRAALRGCMASSPEGRRVLLMGARLALSIDAATRELERIVADQSGDVVMADGTGVGPRLGGAGMGMGMGMGGMSIGMGAGTGVAGAGTYGSGGMNGGTPAPPVLTASWVVVKGEDWEMVDCAA